MSFTIQQLKWKDIKSGLPLVFIDSAHSLNNLIKNLGKNDFYYLNQECKANILIYL